MTEKLGVLIPAHDAAETIEACLKSLRDQTRSPDRVLLIDDASGDDTFSRASQAAVALGLDVTSLRNATRHGVEVINQAVEALDVDLIVIFRPEDRAHPARLAKIAERAAAVPADVIVDGAVGGFDLSAAAISKEGWPEALHPGGFAFRPSLLRNFYPLQRKLSARRWDWILGFWAALSDGLAVMGETLVETRPWDTGLDRGEWKGADLALIEEEALLCERTTQFNYLQLQLRKYRASRPEAEREALNPLVESLTASLRREGLAWAECRNRLMLAGLRSVWSEPLEADTQSKS